MKISELDNKTFLNSTGAIANSYVLINYEDNTTNGPVTYKANLATLGKALAKDMNLLGINGTTHEIQNVNTTTNNGTNTYTEAAPNLGTSHDNHTNQIALMDTQGVLQRPIIPNGQYQIYRDFDLTKAVFINPTNGMLYYGSGSDNDEAITQVNNQPWVVNASDGLAYYNTNVNAFTPVTNINGTPIVLYDAQSEILKYYDVEEDDYVNISVGGGSSSPLYYDDTTNQFYYNSASEGEYVPVPMGYKNLVAVQSADASGVYSLTYNDGSDRLIMAPADPSQIVGDESHQYSYVVADQEDNLYKVIASSEVVISPLQTS